MFDFENMLYRFKIFHTKNLASSNKYNKPINCQKDNVIILWV